MLLSVLSRITHFENYALYLLASFLNSASIPSPPFLNQQWMVSPDSADHTV
jgi:hypothetical protein